MAEGLHYRNPRSAKLVDVELVGAGLKSMRGRALWG